MEFEDYGSKSYVTFTDGGGSVIVGRVRQFAQDEKLFTYTLGLAGGVTCMLYVDLKANRFTMNVVGGESFNGIILSAKQTI